MNPPPASLFTRTVPFHPPRAAQPVPVVPALQAPLQQPLPLPAPPALVHRGEGDVQWIVGWIRDLLVIAMAIVNLLHAGTGH